MIPVFEEVGREEKEKKPSAGGHGGRRSIKWCSCL
jgi:hypothetical protein